MEGDGRRARPPRGLELILPDWFYAGVLDDALVLTIDRAYFDLTGGLERWLYRLVRKHGGRQQGGWSFDFVHLHAKSGSLSPLKHFAYDLREIVRRQTLPGYQLVITRDRDGVERLNFAPTAPIRLQSGFASEVSHLRLGISCESARAIGDRNPRAIGDRILVLSGTGIGLKHLVSGASSRRNFTNQKSFGFLLTDRAAFHLLHNLAAPSAWAGRGV